MDRTEFPRSLENSLVLRCPHGDFPGRELVKQVPVSYTVLGTIFVAGKEAVIGARVRLEADVPVFNVKLPSIEEVKIVLEGMNLRPHFGDDCLHTGCVRGQGVSLAMASNHEHLVDLAPCGRVAADSVRLPVGVGPKTADVLEW